MKDLKRVGIYARVSTSDQSAENQIHDLYRYARERRWQIIGTYVDHGLSGMLASRPGLDELMVDARRRRLDVVLVWRFDRFARSSHHLVVALEEFRSLGVDFVSFQEAIDTSSPLGSAIFTIISAVAQLERDIIAERVRAGLRMARERGKVLGRPRVKFDLQKALRMRANGCTNRQIASALGVSHTTVSRLLKRAGTKTLVN